MGLRQGLLAAGCVLGLAVSASEAATLGVNSGWSTFGFGTAGSSWDTTYSFTLASSAWLLVTDYQFAGDIFTVSVNGLTLLTSIVDTSGAPEYDFTAAYLSQDFSSLTALLGPGSYTISGTAAASPYTEGDGAIALFTALPDASLVVPDLNVIPLPASGLMLLGGLGLAGLLTRRKRRA